MKRLHDEVGMMVEHYCSTRLMKTTTQLYSLPHAKPKLHLVYCIGNRGLVGCLLHKIMELYNTDEKYK